MATKQKKTTRKKTTAKKTTATNKTDKFGSRIGTMTAAVNAALTNTPQTMKQLMKKVGSEGTFYNHMKKMVEEGHVVKTADKKYKLKK